MKFSNNIMTLNKCRSIFFLIVCLFLGTSLLAQLSVEPALVFSPESLIENVFLGEGVEVTEITFGGSNQAVGFFNNGTDNIGLESGIVMSTGNVNLITSNAPTFANSAPPGALGNDVDLRQIAGTGVQDVVSYTIKFIPTSDTLRFRFVFASEEYPGFTCTAYNDVFGFFISGPGITGPFSNNSKNIALVPDPIDPTGLTFTDVPVTINNVNAAGIGGLCNYDYGEYYNVTPASSPPVFNAYLDAFTAQAVVIPCNEYTIKLAIADKDDQMLDTGVFLEAKSFGTGSLEVEAATISLDGTITEGCSDGSITFSLPTPTESDLVIDYTILGDATNGVDYATVPTSLFIPAGDSSVSFPIIAFDDGIIEGLESICVDVQRDICTRDTFCIYIRDNSIVPPDLRTDTTVCIGNSVLLDATLNVTLPEPPVFTNDTDQDIVTISNNNPPAGILPTISEIDVFGVPPLELQEGVLKSVCINIDHPWISDVDVFLFSPGGQFIELTTDNGGSGDDYINTCFTPQSTNPINFGSQAPNTAPPFTGEWKPEGDWSFLWNIAEPPPTNGTWQLQIKDDQTGFNGELLDWSICFNPIYQLSYEWSPAAGLNCSNCPDPLATPDTTTTYSVIVTDSYGCQVFDTVTIEVLPRLDAPDITCGNITDSSIDFEWLAIAGAMNYEVSIEGGAWIPANGATSHLVTGLTLTDTVSIEVRGIGDCPGNIGTQECWTPDCISATPTVNSISPASCIGVDDGTLDITAAGPYPIISYDIPALALSNATGSFTNLPAGDYTVQIIDQVNCPANIDVTIGIKDSLVSNSLLESDINCYGFNTGAVTVEVQGGTLPYDFNWNNTTTDSILSGLAAGTQYVTITDNSGCETLDSITVTQPDSLIINFDVDSVSCFGAGDGVATALPSGGTGTYSYQWDFFTGLQNTQSAIGLDGGSYSLMISDINGCFAAGAIDVIENDSIELTSAGTDVDCFMGTNGTAVVTPIGGTNNFTYSWNDPLNQLDSLAGNLSANTYQVIVSDSDGCTAQTSVLVDEPTGMNITTFTDSTACFNTSDGTGAIIVSGGIYPYNFDWPNVTGTSNDSVYTNLANGTYLPTVTDANMCTQEISVLIESPEAIASSFTTQDVACNGDSTGTATVNLLGGVNPFNFAWDANTNNQATQTAIDLPAGSYQLTITDANSCMLISDTIIYESAALSLSLDQIDVACFDENTGSIDLTTIGGSGGYQFSWTGPGGFAEMTEDIQNLLQGNYQVIVNDVAGCLDTISTNISQPASAISSSMSAPDTICNGLSDGMAMVTAIGGTGTLSYTWDNSVMNNSNMNLSPGEHYVSITDQNNCLLIDTAFIDERSTYTIQLDQVEPKCHDGADGTANVINVDYEGGSVNNNDLSFDWLGIGQSGPTAMNLQGGISYTVVITDAFSCTAEQSILIDNPEEVGIDLVDLKNISCFGGEDGEIQVRATGGSLPFDYIWQGPVNGQDSSFLNELKAGTFLLTVSDAFGCTAVMPFALSQPEALRAEFDIQDLGCNGEQNGSILAMMEGGNPPYRYSWSNGGSSEFIDSIPSNEYFVTITDSKDCIYEDSARVEQPNDVAADIVKKNVSCFGDFDGSMAINPSGGLPPYLFSIDGENFNGIQQVIGLTADTYPVYVQDGNGCIVFIEDVEINQPGELIVDLGADQELLFGENVTLAPIVTNAQGIEPDWEYQWDLNDSVYLNCLQCSSVRVRGLEFDRSFEIHVTDTAGCTASDFVNVFIRKERQVHIPTGFSPNSDGQNDLLLVHGKTGTKVIDFSVYDRWGELVYKTGGFEVNDETMGWDGTFRGKEMNAGVFVWRVEVEFIDGRTGAYDGQTVLVR